MAKHNIKYEVKVLSGANQGATAELHDESGIVIGRSASCDIIFSGANVADRHVAVELEGSSIRLTPLAQPVYIDGKDVGSHEVILRPNQLVNIGVVDFTIADKNEQWPDFDSTKKRLLIASESGVDGSSENAGSSLFGNPWLWLAVVAMLLANVHYLAKDYGGIPGLLGLKSTVSEKLVEAINVDKYPSLYLKTLSSGMTEVKGYVSTNEEKKLFESEIVKFGDKVIPHIFVDTEIEDDARKIAVSLGEDEITFSTLEHGRLKASGLTSSRSKWLNIKESIRSDVQGVTSINDDDVKNLREMFLVLKKEVDKQNFVDRIDLELRARSIVVKGKLTEKEKIQWLQLKEDFLAKSFYPFEFREIIRAPDADIKLSIRSVSVGDIPFVVSKEGNKYFEGSHVGSEYYIDSINDDHILLRNNNIVFPVYFGQEKEQ